jgi:hypothetical protein
MRMRISLSSSNTARLRRDYPDLGFVVTRSFSEYGLPYTLVPEQNASVLSITGSVALHSKTTSADRKSNRNPYKAER